jgi:competence protein ComFC
MSLWSAALDLAYPRVCAACGMAVGDEAGHLCWDCRARLLVIAAPICGRCGDPIDGVAEHGFTCAWCLRNRPSFDLARSAVRYRGPMRAAVHAFKYGVMPCLDRDFTEFLEAVCRTHYARAAFDGVTWIPLHPQRERHRSYNQAELLARRLARRLSVPVMPRCLRRTRATMTQTDLRASERRANVHGAFAAVEPRWIRGRSLLLVDDVMTTTACYPRRLKPQ